MTDEHDEGVAREHAAFADWDAAYVLGALASVERRAFEDHLAGCELCRAAVAELAPLPGLLARVPRPAHGEAATHGEVGTHGEVPPADAAGHDDGATDDEAGADDGPRADLVDLVVRRDRNRRLRRRLGAVGVAAALVVGTAVAVPLATRGPEPAETVTLSRQVDTPLAASVALTPVAWGTRLSMVCTYAAAPGPTAGPYGPPDTAAREYALVVTDVDGTASQVATWTAGPGAVVRLDAATAVPLERIAAVEIRSASGTALLVGDRAVA